MTVSKGGNQEEDIILAGDFGGTKTSFALFAGQVAKLRQLSSKSYPTAAAGSAIELIERFLLETEPGTEVSTACFGVAAPVAAGKAPIVNLPWAIEAKLILAHFGFRKVELINDLVATASAIPYLRSDQYQTVNKVKPSSRGNIGLLAAGTGLGEAFLVWDGNRYLPVPSEGGHKDFAPRTQLQTRLWQFLSEKYGRVSVERVVSGPGLVNIYLFLRQESGMQEPAWLQKLLQEHDAARIISQAALAGEDEVCQKALSLFVEAYGAEAGNLALQGLTLGGVYIAGGIAPKIKKFILAAPFMTAFTAKGRMESLLASMPVRLITDQQAPLWGAAVYGKMG
jgi:glucokinase